MHATDPIEPPAVKDLSAIAAEHNPTRVAFGDGVDGRELTWAGFDEASARAANALAGHVAQGDRVAFCCKASVDHVTAWNGALKAGCIVSNVHATGSPDSIRHCVDELAPRVLVVDDEFGERVAERVLPAVDVDPDQVVSIGDGGSGLGTPFDAFVEGRPADPPDVRVRADDIVAVTWTSGTTGRPKGWCLTNRGFHARGWKLATSKGYSRHSSRIQPLRPAFAAWYSAAAPALLTNASTYFLREWDPEAYLQVIDEKGVTLATLVPTMWRELLEHERFDEYDLSSLEGITAAGEVLDRTTLARLRESVCERVTNAYAATEALGTTISNEEFHGDRIESVGKPHPGTRLRIVDVGGPPDAVKPPGEVGEIVVKGTDVVVWAWGDTATTEAAFEDGWWFSGDLGYVDEDGFLFLEGRRDFVILSKGIKVHPPAVEERLAAHPGVAEAAVVGVDDEEYGEKVTAIVHRTDPDLTPEVLDEWCLESDRLARYERPRAYHFVDRPLPKTSTGKLDRGGARELTDGTDDA